VVAIAMNQVREWRRAGADTLAALDEAHGLADASADFAALTVTRLGLSGQRRETAEAARWLDADDREALSLWWLEVAGRLGRAELAAGLGLPESHAAVRVRRVRQRLETARAVVRAPAAPSCTARPPPGTGGRPRCGASACRGTCASAPPAPATRPTWCPPSGCSPVSAWSPSPPGSPRG
jgi:hypothetical protein